MTEQITLEGELVPLDKVATRAKTSALTAAQAAILRRVAEHGSIRSVEAGTLVHRARNGGTGCWWRAHGAATPGGGCCGYASSDGTDACKRLAKRGLLVGDGKGRWTRP